MVDHLGRAAKLRQHAAKCSVAAGGTTSSAFKTCYKLLAVNYLIQARLEEDFAAATERIALAARQGQGVSVLLATNGHQLGKAPSATNGHRLSRALSTTNGHQLSRALSAANGHQLGNALSATNGHQLSLETEEATTL